MAVYSMANAAVYIGTQTGATNGDLSSYSTDTYTQIGEVESISGLDDVQNFAEFTALSDTRARQFKTTRRGENITLRCAYDPGDAGQDAVRTAAVSTSNTNYNFKIVYNDTDTSVSPQITTGTTVYWSGLVGNNSVPDGSVEDIEMVDYTITNNTGFTIVERN